MKLDVLKTDGTNSGDQVELSPDIFGIEPNEHAVWLAVTAELDHKRQGTSATKNRAAVRGGGKKPWPQKGRGTARAGSIRSPIWVGGGRVFGPEPRSYKTRLPLKVRQLARKSILSVKAKDGKIRLVEDFSLKAPKTQDLHRILESFKLSNVKTLLLLDKPDRIVWLSGRNIPMLSVKPAAQFSVYDAANSDVLLIQKSALMKIHEVLAK
ncbi:MAG TPA: 50S ribosomal protein L4 [bacterium]